MKLGIMQPYFFPYLGHFALIAHTDQWVVFDITQYTPKSYMTRNDVFKQGGGRQRIFAELSNASIHILTKEALLKNPAKTRQQVLGSLSHYKKIAPFYYKVIKLINSVFEQLDESDAPDSLVEINTIGLRVICEYLGLSFKVIKASELELDIPAEMSAGQWAPLICKKLGAKHYLNPIGGQQIFNPDDFKRIGVELEFMEAAPFEYPTGPYSFEPNLSVLDALMWNHPDALRAHLENHSKTISAS